MNEGVATPVNALTPAGNPMGESEGPGRTGRWLLAAILGATFVFLQIALVIPVIVAAFARGLIASEADLEAYLTSEAGLLTAVMAAAVSGVVTVILAFGWPALWNLASRGPRYGVADWLSWQAPARVRTVMVMLITVPILVALGALVALLLGDAAVDAQMMLFSSPLLQAVSLLVVTFIAPLAEEIVFRGALYNALLRRARVGEPPWLRHVLPVAVVTIAFAGLHIFAGFERVASIILITAFSLYLTLLRAYTGSTQATVAGHMVWNLIGSLALIAQNALRLPS